MRIFISWSGETSKQVAQALGDWLPDVLQSVRPFFSAADLQPGTRWGPELGRELEQISFGVCCMTPDNLQKPWVMFEAGALSKQVATARLVPYLFRVEPSDLEGPLTQFQSVAADKEGTYRLVDSIHASMATPSLPAERLAKSFERWWPELESKLNAIAAQPATPAPPVRSERDILNELLLTVRNLERQKPGTWTVSYLESARKRGRQSASMPIDAAGMLYHLIDIVNDATLLSMLRMAYPEFRAISPPEIIRTFRDMSHGKQADIIAAFDSVLTQPDPSVLDEQKK